MKNAEWILKDFDKELSAVISDDCELPRPIANVLAGRGFKTKEEVEEFIEKRNNKYKVRKKFRKTQTDR